MTNEEPKVQLYAVAINKRVRLPNGKYTWIPAGIEYTHATSVDLARACILRVNPNAEVIAAGPAIGFYEADKQGRILLA